jgi:outer membrane protein assembly factor BamB
MRTVFVSCFASVLFVSTIGAASAGDWSGFRGPNSSGIGTDGKIPLKWSSKENLQWKTKLPGPGSSSPITVGDKVFVTCYSGYGESRDSLGSQDNLKRHLVCIDQKSGEILWDKSVKSTVGENRFSGIGIPQHGYSSSTPVSDGENIFVFFGKTGVLAFDLKGNQLWETSVGTDSGPRQFGSAASPILYKNMVIINASEESESLIALNKKTGEEVWKAEASALVGSWSTPILVETKDGNQELVINAPNEVWGMNPDTGKLVWYAEAIPGSPVNPTLVAKDGIVYAMGGRGGGRAAAIRTGGKGDVTKTHVLWTANLGSYVPSPVIHGGHLYWVSDQGQACCLKADTGKTVYRSRLSGRGACYASAVLADGKLFAVSRTNGTYVLALGEKFEQLARNELEGDDSDFNGSPAVSNGRLFLRSNQALYCIRQK